MWLCLKHKVGTYRKTSIFVGTYLNLLVITHVKTFQMRGHSILTTVKIPL